MDAELSAALARRLAAYSATAGVALAVAAEADGQIVYHDLRPDAVVHTDGAIPDTYALDFDDDGIVDTHLFGCGYTGWAACGQLRYYYYKVGFRLPEGGNAQNGILGYYIRPYYYYYLRGAASRLDNGSVVGPAGPGQGFYPYVVAAFRNGTTLFPFAGEEGYAGFRFVGGDGEFHYGWLRLAVDDGVSEGTLFEYAYEATPETPIAAGAVSAAMLDGEVNRTAFPPSGGTLHYTATVTNGSDEPVQVELWVEAEHEGGTVTRRRLGSGTLAPGASYTGMASVEVPTSALAGSYEVDFKAGDYASGRFVTFERYAMTKAASAREAGGRADLFAEVSAEGDFFATAGAPAIAGTHTLSEASPNPATGQAALTLQVSEAQHVQVEVLDALGRRVAFLHDGPMAPGTEHRLVFDGSSLPVGVYVVRAVGEAFSDARLLTLVR